MPDARATPGPTIPDHAASGLYDPSVTPGKTVRVRPARRLSWALIVVWSVTRLVVLLLALDVIPDPWRFATGDARDIYREWYGVLRSGSFPAHDVRWQYPPGAAAVLLLPGVLPFDYATSVYAVMLAADALVFGLLVSAATRGRSTRGPAVWVIGVPLLGPMVLARYDLAVTALAVAALLLSADRRTGRHRWAGVLAGTAAAIKVWPLLLFAGVPGTRRTTRLYGWTFVGGVLVVGACAWALPGAFAFLGFQRDRGIEVESVLALPFHAASWFGWSGTVRERYGSLELHGPCVGFAARLGLLASAAGFAWLVVWRVGARRFTGATPCDAALCALLLFVVTSRVISPQYMVWLLGLAAVCALHRDSSQRDAVTLILLAVPPTALEFPMMFGDLLEHRPHAVLVLFLRNAMLVAATSAACRGLWRSTRSPSALLPQPLPVARERDPLGSRGV